jgi:hypothetical protein
MVVPRFDSGQSTRGGTPNGFGGASRHQTQAGASRISKQTKSECSPAHWQICSQSLICLCRLCIGEVAQNANAGKYRCDSQSIDQAGIEDNGELDRAVDA